MANRDLPADVSMTLWMLVELERDRETVAGRKSIRHAAAAVVDRWDKKYGKKINSAKNPSDRGRTLRNHHQAASRLFAERCKNGEHERMLNEFREARKRINAAGYEVEDVKLLGFSDEELNEWVFGPRSFTKGAELALARADLRESEAKLDEINKHIARLQSERDAVLAEITRIKPSSID